MRSTIRIYIVPFILFLTTQLIVSVQRAVTIVPVADLVGKSQYALYPHKKASQLYRSFPEFDSAFTCPRLHQLLFNEIVEILEERGGEVKVQIPNLFHYINTDLQTKRNEFWMEKRHLVVLDTLLKKNGTTANIFPAPIDFKQQAISSHNKNTVTLVMPFHDPVINQTFSAGTRFVRTENQTDSGVEVFIFDVRTYQVKKSLIPKSLCFIESGQTKQERIQAFLSVLKRWAHLPDGFISYVWGGCSFTLPEKTEFKQYTKTKNNKITTVFTYKNDKHSLKTGLDCSGLITRAAQICGIPYFFKNSTTIAQSLTPLSPDERMSNGDIIWFKGHVFIASNIKQNLLIEARGYQGGYGKIHEIGLHNLFKEINTYQELMKAMHTKQKLTIVDKNGQKTAKVDQIKILKLASIWK
ncbi:MAG: hypothetical protein Q8Q25_02990 [bacterium]|nr:hypothetical protein [bacterium]